MNAVIAFLLFVGENFEFDFLNLTTTNWLIQFMDSYFFLIVVFSFCIGFFIFFNIFSGMISSRKKEIGMIKAIGGIPELIRSVLLWEIVLISITGIFLGIISGFMGYEIFYFFMKTQYFITNNFPVWTLLLQIFLFLFLAWLFGGIQVGFTYGQRVAKLMTDELELERNIFKPKKIRPQKFRFGLAYHFAKNNVKRRRVKSNRFFLNFILGNLLLSVALMGSFVFEQTVIDNQKLACGENMVVVGHKDLVFQYTSRMVLYDLHLGTFMNYTQDKYRINSSVLSEFESIPFILTDPRLITEYVVQEVPYVEGYNQIGDTRMLSTFVIGARPERFIPNTQLIKGDPFRLALYFSGPYFVIVGDWLERNLFDDSSVQYLLIHGAKEIIPNSVPMYKILGTCVDPFNGGNVIYMNIDHLQDLTGFDDYNLLLIRYFHPGSLIEIMNKINQLNAFGNEYIMLGTDSFLNNNISYTRSFWLPFLILPFILFGMIFFNLLSHVNNSIKQQMPDFGILRVLGAKSSTIKKVIFFQSLQEIILPSALGIFMGASITFYLLYTHIFSFFLLFSIAIGLFLSMFLIAFISMFPAHNIIKKKALASIIYQ